MSFPIKHWAIKVPVLIIIFLIIHPGESSAQDCGNDCHCILNLARQYAKAENPDFQKALRLYNAAKVCYPDSSDTIDGEIVTMFVTINNLKVQADSASDRAQTEAQNAVIALDSAQSATLRALQEKDRADSALVVVEEAKDSLIEAKKRAEEQYKRATANENSVLINNALEDKKQFEAWSLGLAKRQLIGDSLGMTKAELLKLLKQNDRILIKTDEYSSGSTKPVFVNSAGFVFQPGPSADLPLNIWDVKNDLKTVLVHNIPAQYFFSDTYTYNGFHPGAGLKIKFSADGSRIAIFNRDVAKVFLVHRDSTSKISSKLLFKSGHIFEK